MPIVVCPGCQASLRIGDAQAGKAGRCPKCQTRIKVPPAAPAPESPPATPEANIPLASRTADSPTEKRVRPGPTPDAPSVARDTRPRLSLPVAIAGGIALFVLGGGAVWYAMRPGPDIAAARSRALGQVQPAPGLPPAMFPGPAGVAPPFPGPMPPAGAVPGLVPPVAAPPRLINTDTYPDLPPPPVGIRKAPFTPEPVASNATLRTALIDRHERAFRDVLSDWHRAAGELKTLTDAAEAPAAAARVRDALASAQQKTKAGDALEKLTREEDLELTRRVAGQALATRDLLRPETDRIGKMPGLDQETKRVLVSAIMLEGGLNKFLERAASASANKTYVEMYIADVPTRAAATAFAEKLRALTDSPFASSQVQYNAATKKAACRVWPIGDREAFAAKIDFGKTRVSGQFLYITADPAAAASIGVAATPEAAPAAPPAAAEFQKTDSLLTRIRSRDEVDRGRALIDMKALKPGDERRSEVLAAVTPLMLSPDPTTSIYAVEIYIAWEQEGNSANLIEVVSKGSHELSRRAAITELGHRKAEEAVPAIIKRLGDDTYAATMALREFGPGVESAVISVLDQPDATAARAACEVLDEIGGGASLEPLSKLANTSDARLKSAARAARSRIRGRMEKAQRAGAR